MGVRLSILVSEVASAPNRFFHSLPPWWGMAGVGGRRSQAKHFPPPPFPSPTREEGKDLRYVLPLHAKIERETRIMAPWPYD